MEYNSVLVFFMSTLTDGYFSLSQDINKVHEGDTSEGVTSQLLPELDLSMTDDELIDLKKDWMRQWEPYSKEVERKQKDNEDYWLGKHFASTKETRPLVDNLIFEALETFLPIATRPKADPIVDSDNTEAGNAIADKVRKMLIYLADAMSYNLKVKQAVRYWALYHIGVMKIGWSMKENDVTCISVRPQKLILDPKATIEECEYNGYYIGEYLEDMASDLVLRFPKQKDLIEEKTQGKMGTKVQYILWTTDEYIFWTMDDKVLGKNKNPHWNYETQKPAPIDQFGNQPLDPNGQPMMQTIPPRNHFNRPRKPYVFFSVFNLGKHPHDDTNLIQQNLPLQDLINKRLSQIDKNADNANGGLALSGDAFTELQAQTAGRAKRNGGVIWVPTGKIGDAVQELSGSPLPNFIYESLIDYRNELRNIFGTRGSTPQGTQDEQTVRGKLIVKGQDSDRIGGGISTYLEQFSDHVFNWFVQLMYVYYDEPHYASVLGKERTQEYITLINTDFGTTKLTVGVKDGSMVPHDPVNKRNEALELWAAQGIDPITFFDRLEFPNPRESAKQLFLWKADPIALFPDLQAQQQQQMAQQQQQMANQQGQQVQQQQQAQSNQSNQDHQNKIEQLKVANLHKFLPPVQKTK